VRETMYLVPNEREYSEKTAEDIDSEIKRIMDEAYQEAKKVIEGNRGKLENVAQALLKYETLDADDVKIILDGGRLNKPTVGDLLAAEQAKAPKDGEKQEQSVAG
jgi:cell division protease FtsH